MILKRNFHTCKGSNSLAQTKILFEKLHPYINETIRTWLFIKDIDNTYSSVSDARNYFFDKIGLKEPYFASTGIGRPDKYFYPGEFVHLVALIVPGLNRSELTHMENLNVMPHTKTYDVRFERGVIYKDNYIVSGTASIDENGNVKYEGHLKKQIYRALNNIHQLLSKYGQSIHNTKKIVGYVRNSEHITAVKKECQKINSNIDWHIIEGKICRPEWLVEFETIIKAGVAQW